MSLDHVRLLRITRVAEVLGCSRRHVYSLIAAGRLRPIRISARAVRVSESEVERFLAEQLAGPPNAAPNADGEPGPTP